MTKFFLQASKVYAVLMHFSSRHSGYYLLFDPSSSFFLSQPAIPVEPHGELPGTHCGQLHQGCQSSHRHAHGRATHEGLRPRGRTAPRTADCSRSSSSSSHRLFSSRLPTAFSPSGFFRSVSRAFLSSLYILGCKYCFFSFTNLKQKNWSLVDPRRLFECLYLFSNRISREFFSVYNKISNSKIYQFLSRIIHKITSLMKTPLVNFYLIYKNKKFLLLLFF